MGNFKIESNFKPSGDQITAIESLVKGLENNIPFCNYNDGTLNTKIRFHTLHFIVWSKLYMKKLYQNKDLNFNPYYINIYREFNVFKNKIKKIFR